MLCEYKRKDNNYGAKALLPLKRIFARLMEGNAEVKTPIVL